KTWESVLAAENGEVAEAIRLGGLANQKTKVIKDLLQKLKETRIFRNFCFQMASRGKKKCLKRKRF
ncbi:MAG: hypothetical protein M3388_02880, partial [Acidobacteriota bacterium]|nr:hypothetical protein [Acidobacteriota bacterium]